MQLSPGERSILAFFPNSTSAQEAAHVLKEVGIEESRLTGLAGLENKDKGAYF